MSEDSKWDVAVIGGGPAGLAAAITAAKAGARTVVLERAEYPRYKTCGGGLIGTSLDVLSPLIEAPPGLDPHRRVHAPRRSRVVHRAVAIR